ncbi:FAD/FMN-containing dehydrogenase [Pseudomonas sp. RIT-PI-AD]|uniref:FAD/FMN-containing dehydrogenase n=1 Tax=Pseudomonas sp. RIT-PI-AD TaxID=3035294 RepID=UPI0021DA2ED0|nr:FAD/FMN-containing dehydrogenase [Pseudomonas sp. RIT-PI-AD]
MRSGWVLILLALSAGAWAIEPGERLAPWTLLDQHERAYSLDDQVRVLLVARSMAGAKLVQAALAERPKDYLERRHGVFVADISRMPGLVSRLFALPAMRDYPYRVMLDRDARIAPRYMATEEGVMGLFLRDGVLRERRLLGSAAEVTQALESDAQAVAR